MANREPPSIRYKNPGAVWGSALAIKWGANKQPVTLNDGKGQGNNIAVFPSYVLGICAQLDLWRSSSNYRNKAFADAIVIWSGHNEVESYIAFVLKRVPGMTRSTVMNDTFWRSPSGIAFLKAQAWHEAGKPYPAPDADWIEAYGGKHDIGWGAQTSHAISPDLATPGGWWIDVDGNRVPEGTPGASYWPWMMDKTARIPYLWASVSRLIDKIEQPEAELLSLKNHEN
jgi:hypothetical protein